MKKGIVVILGVLVLLITNVLGQYPTTTVNNTTSTMTPAPTMVANNTSKTALEPTANGKGLYNYFTNGSNYKTWSKWPGKQDYYPKSPESPHGALLITYVSGNAISTIQNKLGELPDDTIIIKENYDANKTLMGLSVLYKEDGYDTANNNWFWASYSPNGTVQAEGKVQRCIGCHVKAKDNDYIFSSIIKAPVAATPTAKVTPIYTTVQPTVVTTTTSTPPKTPGFESAIGFISIFLILVLGKIKRRN